MAARKPVPVAMWAAVVHGKRSSWIHCHTIRRLRRDARAAYLEHWLPEYHRQALDGVTFERVTVAPEEKKP